MGFYVFKLKPESAGGETEFSDLRPIRTREAPKCDKCGGFVGMLTCLPPYRVELELWDSVFGDIAFGPGGDLLVSERLKTLWQKHGLVGLQGFDPVEIVKVKRHKYNKPDLFKQPNYFRVTIIRSRAAVDAQQSGLERENGEICPACRLGKGTGIIRRAQRIMLEVDSWMGEDVFFARGLPGIRLASERLKKLIDDYEITGATLIPAEEYSFDFYPNEPRE